MDPKHFTVPRELLDPERRGELANWIEQHTGGGAAVREVLERIDRLPLAPAIEQIEVIRDPHPERHLGGLLWHWRMLPIRKGWEDTARLLGASE